MFYVHEVRLINFLWERGITPDYEIGNTALYRRTKRLNELLDKYYIRYVCIPNKWG